MNFVEKCILFLSCTVMSNQDLYDNNKTSIVFNCEII